MKLSLEKDFVRNLFSKVESASITSALKDFSRQPVHVVYGGADKFTSGTILKLGKLALEALENYACDYKTFFEALNIPLSDNSEIIYKRIVDKLKTEPLEDYRIDFEDGFGIRTNNEEDNYAENTAVETAKAMKENTLPPFFGIRMKPLNEDFKERGVRTLDIFLTKLLSETDGKFPQNFLITLPKISSPKEVSNLITLLEMFEKIFRLPEHSLKFEMMIETPEIIFNSEGRSGLNDLISASAGRCFAAHFGVYDFTSSLDISAKNQSLDHPLCDFVRSIMKITFSGSGIFLSDGATNILPVPRFKNENLSEEERKINRELIWNAWSISFKNINHSLHYGFYQGWDLHPTQIPVRYAAVYSFFLEELEIASNRLKGFIDKAAQVSLSGNTFDDAASAQALLNFFIRGLNCGAFSEEDIKKTGLSLNEIKSKSFMKIMELRKKN